MNEDEKLTEAHERIRNRLREHMRPKKRAFPDAITPWVIGLCAVIALALLTIMLLLGDG